MYVTGGIGPAASNEGFTDYYDLPNESAYAETCAAVGLMMWASRMLGRGPDRLYADIMEQALYNGALSGLATDGARFFYDNPLESAGDHHRWIWHRCPCCPPNIGRTVAAIGSYMYAVSDDEVAIHLYGESTARLKVGTTPVTIDQRTNYPWDGRVAITIGWMRPPPSSCRCGYRVGAARRRCRSMARRSMPRQSRTRAISGSTGSWQGGESIAARPADGHPHRPRQSRREGRSRPCRPGARAADLLRRGSRQCSRASTA